MRQAAEGSFRGKFEISRDAASIRFVLSGAPSSGKTTTATAIAERRPSWNVCGEVATSLIASSGRDSDEAAFTERVLIGKLSLEEESSASRVTIFDRGVPDTIAYLELSSASNDLLASLQLSRRYRHIFIFDPLPFEYTEFRKEFDRNAVNFLDQRLDEVYRTLGYEVTRVPRLSIDERASFIIERIEPLLRTTN